MAEVERERSEALDRLIDALDLPQSASDDLRPLVALAAELRRSLAPAASTVLIRDRVLSRVLRQARAQTPAARRRSATERRRPLILRPAYAIAGLALTLGLTFGTGAAYAAESTLPGDALYPVKRSLEEVRLALSVTAAGDAALAASFTDRRLAEVETLTERGRWDDVDQALQAYATSVDDLVRLQAMVTDPGRSADIEAQLSRHLEVLERVQSKAPDPAQPALLQALERAGRGRPEAGGRQDDKKKPDHNPPGQEKKSTESPGPGN